MVDHKDYIDELLFSLKEEDEIKLGVLLRHIDEVDHLTQRRFVFELSRADESFALPIIIKLGREKSSLLSELPELRQVLISKCSHFASDLCNLYGKGEITDKQFLEELVYELPKS